MKIAHVFWTLSYGGIETMLVNIVNYQVKTGADIDIIIINDTWDQRIVDALDSRIRLHVIGRKIGSKTPWFIWRYNSLLHRLNPDVVHLHYAPFYGITLSEKFSKRCVSTLHDIPNGKTSVDGKLSFLKSFKLVNFRGVKGNMSCIDKIPKVFAISNAVHDALIKRYGIKNTVIANGIHTDKFKRKTEYVQQSPMRIVQVSRLDHVKKGQDLLIKAASALRGKITIDFIGDGESEAYLKDLTKQLDIEDNVNFLGTRTQDYIMEHLCEYDLFVQPSRIEGFGLTVAEAMSAGVPALVSAGEGPSEITCGDIYGWTFTNNDAENLTAKIEFIIENYDLAVKKAAKALIHVRELYDVSVTAQSYLDNYPRF